MDRLIHRSKRHPPADAVALVARGRDDDHAPSTEPEEVLLTADDEVVVRRLAGRETGSGLERHTERGATTAVRVEAEAGEAAVRVAADGRSVAVTGRAPTR